MLKTSRALMARPKTLNRYYSFDNDFVARKPKINTNAPGEWIVQVRRPRPHCHAMITSALSRDDPISTTMR